MSRNEITGDALTTGASTDAFREGHERIWGKKVPKVCRTDGRCQYAIDIGAEGMGHCPEGKCVMPEGACDEGPGEEDGPWAPGWAQRTGHVHRDGPDGTLETRQPDGSWKPSERYRVPPFTCLFCGAPSWVDPSDQSPPPDYCHESDHGSADE